MSGSINRRTAITRRIELYLIEVKRLGLPHVDEHVEGAYVLVFFFCRRIAPFQ